MWFFISERYTYSKIHVRAYFHDSYQYFQSFLCAFHSWLFRRKRCKKLSNVIHLLIIFKHTLAKIASIQNNWMLSNLCISLFFWKKSQIINSSKSSELFTTLSLQKIINLLQNIFIVQSECFVWSVLVCHYIGILIYVCKLTLMGDGTIWKGIFSSYLGYCYYKSLSCKWSLYQRLNTIKSI